MSLSRLLPALVFALTAAGPAQAQLSRSSVRPGDEQAERSLLAFFEAWIRSDSTNTEALIEAAAIAVDLAEFNIRPAQRDSLLARGEDYARRAVAVQPENAEARFQLARALGRKALTMPTLRRGRYAVEVRAHAVGALAADPTHAGALHVLGVWHQSVMQLSGFERMMGKLLMGGKVLGQASWEEAGRNLELAVSVEPDRIVHRLDLARFYLARKRYDEAREQLQWISNAPAADYNDHHFKREAAELLTALATRS